MNSNLEMTVPKYLSNVIFQLVFVIIIVVFFILAVMNICDGSTLALSTIWILLVIWGIWSSSKQTGFRRFFLDCLAGLIGRDFVESPQNGLGEIGFGYEFLNHRHIKQTIKIVTIESVEWTTGQATQIAGRDMNDWHVCVWFDHNDPIKSEKQRSWHRKPDQDIYIVGPSRGKDRTEAFGLAFVAFLRKAGTFLEGDTNGARFVRVRAIS